MVENMWLAKIDLSKGLSLYFIKRRKSYYHNKKYKKTFIFQKGYKMCADWDRKSFVKTM